MHAISVALHVLTKPSDTSPQHEGSKDRKSKIESVTGASVPAGYEPVMSTVDGLALHAAVERDLVRVAPFSTACSVRVSVRVCVKDREACSESDSDERVTRFERESDIIVRDSDQVEDLDERVRGRRDLLCVSRLRVADGDWDTERDCVSLTDSDERETGPVADPVRDVDGVRVAVLPLADAEVRVTLAEPDRDLDGVRVLIL